MLIFKNTFKKIQKELGRFISLVFIVALGAAFFAGVRETSSDMIKTLDEYYDTTNLLDFRIISTMGLTDDDITALKNLENVAIVEENYSYETIIDGDATKIYGITEYINNLTLISGRMPQSADECLVLDGSYNIGDTITIDDETSSDYLNNTTFTVVGTVRSSMYIYSNLGISTVSDGKLDNIIYIDKDNFNLEYYTEIYLIAKDSQEATSYENDYEEAIDYLLTELEKLAPIQETRRYEQIKTEAMEKIYDAREEIATITEENEEDFNEALNALNSAQIEINAGYQEINSGYDELEKQRISTEQILSEQEQTLTSALNEINLALENIGITTESIELSLNSLNEQISTISVILESMDSTNQEYIYYSTLLTNLNEITTNLIDIDSGLTALAEAKETWNTTYEETLNTLSESKNTLDESQKALDESYAQYYQSYNLFQEEINNALAEIEEAEEEIENLEKPEWYLFSREDNSGYTTFLESATKIDAIAAVFPLFFIAVAFLMCLNTMTRMIEEERTEIGIFTSLGISKYKIILSYTFYVTLATTIGILIGLSIGYTIIPQVLYNVYTNSFIIPSLKTYVNIPICIAIIVVCLLTMILVTIYAVNRNFKYAPATLLRPLSPKSGRKVLLEKINFIWKKISFSWKVTIRNLFRYKKRIIMTLIGISGCTALLLTGFGIKDSISKILDIQFNDIQTYDSMLILNEELTTSSPEITSFLESLNITNPLYTHLETLTFNANNKNIDCYAIAFEENDITNYFNLTDVDEVPLTLSDNGAIVTQKIADLLDVSIGDTITLRDSNNEIYIIKISGISKNYINNYIYMSKDYYEVAFQDITYNTIITNINEQGNAILESEYFSNIQYTQDSISMLQDIIDSMNNIVFLIIAFSSFLAITVLYNLTTINISERIREIATLKVLGFNDHEISMYVYKETIILTIIGICIGIFLGLGLNYFVLTVAETDEIIFIKDINYLSYIYTIIIMVIFTIVVQIITSFILKKINMIDSLKSVE